MDKNMIFINMDDENDMMKCLGSHIKYRPDTCGPQVEYGCFRQFRIKLIYTLYKPLWLNLCQSKRNLEISFEI